MNSVSELTRPIVGIENRTAQEVFDIMCDRFRLSALSPRVKASDILSQVALWSDDEGLDLSMGQGEDLVRRIMSAIEVSASPRVVTDETVKSAAWELCNNGPLRITLAQLEHIEEAVRSALTAALSSAGEKEGPFVTQEAMDELNEGLGRSPRPTSAEFKPCVIVNEEARTVEIVIEDAAYIAVPQFDGIHHYMDRYEAIDDRRLVGFAIWQTLPPTSADKLEVVGAVERFGEAVFGRHERGFVMWPLVDGEKMQAELTSIITEQAERIAELEEDIAAKEFALRNGRSLAEDSINSIRELLDHHNVPKAAFIDDHVGNAIAQLNAAEADRDRMKEALRGVLDEYDRNICTHETTHRGGAIWTICDTCDAKWADDKGGFQAYSDPEPIAIARAALNGGAEK